MQKTLKTYRFHRRGGVRTAAIELTISQPNKSPGLEEFFCEVECDEVFQSKKKIMGASPEQAISLAMKFAEQVLSGGGYIDEDGHPM